MSSFRNPVGPQSASVYWRRRLVVGLGLLAVIVVILLIVWPRGGDTTPPATTNSESPSEEAPDGATPDPAATGAPAAGDGTCDPAMVTVDPALDASEYEAGVNPVLTFTLRSTMTEPCLFAAGSDVQEFIITSGDETIWSSKDCQVDAVEASVMLEPGVPKQGSTITWDRTRSSVDTCGTEREQVIAGGASYHLDVVVGGVDAIKTKQFLLY